MTGPLSHIATKVGEVAEWELVRLRVEVVNGGGGVRLRETFKDTFEGTNQNLDLCSMCAVCPGVESYGIRADAELKRVWSAGP